VAFPFYARLQSNIVAATRVFRALVIGMAGALRISDRRLELGLLDMLGRVFSRIRPLFGTGAEG
jgi:hypothetical protein